MTDFNNVASEAALRDAIFATSNDFATDDTVNNGPYTIKINGDVTLSQSLLMIRGLVPGGGSTRQVFVVESSAVAINHTTIDNAMAHSANGGGAISGGGGSGLLQADRGDESELVLSAFPGIGPKGGLAADLFATSTSDPDALIVYDQQSGDLSCGGNGSDPARLVKFA